jgi:hypothetical protein
MIRYSDNGGYELVFSVRQITEYYNLEDKNFHFEMFLIRLRN